MKPLSLVIQLLVFFCLKGNAQPAWTNYTNDRLISDVVVIGNNVWVGSQGGLTRTHLLTGEFQTYLPCNSPIKGGGIEAIKHAPDDALWFASENAGVFRLKSGNWTNYYDNITFSMFHQIGNLQILANGDVWFFVEQFDDRSLNRLVRIRNGEVERFGNLPEQLASVCVLNDSTIYIATTNSILKYNALHEQIIEIFDENNSILSPDDRFTEIITDKNGTLIIPSPGRILQIKNGILTVLSAQGLSALKAFTDGIGNVFLSSYKNEPSGVRLIKWDGSSISYFKDVDFMPYPVSATPVFRGADHQGGLYASIFNVETEFTLFRFFENEWTPVKTQIYPLLNNYQDDVQSDCEGNLWFGSLDGVDVRYTDGTWEHFAVEVSPQTYFNVGQMAVDPVTCDVWFANISNSGGHTVPGLIRIANGVVTEFLFDHANVYDVEVTLEGKVYFYSAEEGFGFIEDDEVHYIDRNEELLLVLAIDSDSKGNIYLADWGSKLYKYDGTTLTLFEADEFTSVVYGVYVDNEDNIWAHFSGGVKLYDGATWTDYSYLWPVNTYSGMIQDKKGNYWVSTWNDGLYYWDRQSLQHFDIFNSGLTTNNLHSVALDPSGRLIVTQQVGASVLDIQDNTEPYKGTGTVFFDYEKDGVFTEGTDILVPGQKIRDTDRDLWAISNIYGKYAFYAESPDEYTFRHEVEEYAESTTVNPQNGLMEEEQSILPDFGYWKPQIPDVHVSISNGVPVCNRDFRVYIVLRNNSPFPISGHFSLRFNDLLILKQSSMPFSQSSPGLLIFEDLDIEGLGILVIHLDFEAPGLTAENSSLYFQGLFDTSDGPFTANTGDTILCSYDPNDKKVEPTGDYIPGYSLIVDPLKYTIRFQNEGTYKAFDILIVDTLESNLDPATFELVASSHPVETTVTADGIVTFNFPNIDLPARSEDESGSQGFISFTVKPDSTLSVLQQIENKASIYFDFNPPIVTNITTWHVVDDLAIVSTKEAFSDVYVYPNPSDGTLHLNTTEEGKYHVLDVTGRLRDTGSLQTGSNTILLNEPSGIYYLQVFAGHRIHPLKKIVVIK